MGTRNLTAVKSNGEFKIAQYGQWDGYPSGQGETIIEFIENNDLEKFKEKVNKLEFFTQEELEQLDSTGNWQETHKYLSRDLGAKILHAVMHGEYVEKTASWLGSDEEPSTITHEFNIKKLKNDIEFAADSLFCEYAYLLDLDEMELIVCEGFQKQPHNKNVFGVGKKDKDYDGQKEYYPVKAIAKFDLEKDNLRSRWDNWLQEYNK